MTMAVTVRDGDDENNEPADEEVEAVINEDEEEMEDEEEDTDDDDDSSYSDEDYVELSSDDFSSWIFLLEYFPFLFYYLFHCNKILLF